jgi:hypothetical protein
LARHFHHDVSETKPLIYDGWQKPNGAYRNAYAVRYTVYDNLGDSVTMPLVSAGGLGAATFSLPGNGLTMVDISSANANAWDFAIDNVTFTPATSTPEPESLLLLAAGVALLAAVCRRQLRVWQ